MKLKFRFRILIPNKNYEIIYWSVLIPKPVEHITINFTVV